MANINFLNFKEVRSKISLVKSSSNMQEHRFIHHPLLKDHNLILIRIKHYTNPDWLTVFQGAMVRLMSIPESRRQQQQY